MSDKSDKDYAVHFGTVVKEYRESAKLTQAQLAQRTKDKLSLKQIGDIERGKPLLKRADVENLAAAFGLYGDKRVAFYAQAGFVYSQSMEDSESLIERF